MKITKKKDPTQEPLIKARIPDVDIHTTVDHLAKEIRKQRKTRDALCGELYAGLYDHTGRAVQTKLNIEIEDELLASGFTRDQIDDLEFADAFDAVREKNLVENNGKSQNNPFWAAAWGVYAEAMVNMAKNQGKQKTLFGQLFN